MKTMLRLAFLWYVVTYTGQAVAGPFTTIADCAPLAQRMSKSYSNVSPYCQFKLQ